MSFRHPSGFRAGINDELFDERRFVRGCHIFNGTIDAKDSHDWIHFIDKILPAGVKLTSTEHQCPTIGPAEIDSIIGK